MYTLEQNKVFTFSKQLQFEMVETAAKLQFGYNASDTGNAKQRSTDWLVGNLQKRFKNSFTTYCDDAFIDQ